MARAMEPVHFFKNARVVRCVVVELEAQDQIELATRTRDLPCPWVRLAMRLLAWRSSPRKGITATYTTPPKARAESVITAI